MVMLPGAASDAESEVGRTIASLELSIHHLERSNAELEVFMKENGPDKELRVAIGENIIVIARRKAILEDLQKQAGVLPAPSAAALPTTDTAVAHALPATVAEDAMAVDVTEGAAVSSERSGADPSEGVYL